MISKFTQDLRYVDTIQERSGEKQTDRRTKLPCQYRESASISQCRRAIETGQYQLVWSDLNYR